MILVLDHDDSFVHTLARYLTLLGEQPSVVRATAIRAHEVTSLAPSGVVLSPGPGAPADYPVTLEIVRALGDTTPILGVCLGHQCIAHAHGASVSRAVRPRHGMTSPITHDGLGVYTGLPQPFDATRYHSLAVDVATVPESLLVTSIADDDGTVMGVRHVRHPVEGVQFHPESILTNHGYELMRTWVASLDARR